MKRLILYLLFLSGCVFFSVESTAQGKWVEAEGQGTIISGNVSLARDEALIDARLKALESLGVSVDSRTVITGTEMIDQTLVTRTKGIIESYQVLREQKDEQRGIYVMRIKAKVVSDVEQGKTAQYLQGWKTLAYLSVSVDGKEDSRTAERVNRQFFSKLEENRYQLPYIENVNNIRRERQFQSGVNGDIASMLSYGKRLPSRMVILGNADVRNSSTTQVPSYSGGKQDMIFYRADIAVKAVDAQTGEVVASYSTTAQGVKGSGSTKQLALDRTIDKALQGMLNEVMPGLAVYRNSKSRMIDIYVYDVPDKGKYDYIKNLISKARWVKMQSKPEFAACRVSKFSIFYSEDTYILVSALQQNRDMVIKDFDWDRIVIKYLGYE